jgi:hypothetical protein
MVAQVHRWAGGVGWRLIDWRIERWMLLGENTREEKDPVTTFYERLLPFGHMYQLCYGLWKGTEPGSNEHATRMCAPYTMGKPSAGSLGNVL